MRLKIISNFKKRWKLLLLLLVILIGVSYWFFGRPKAEKEELTFIKPTRGDLVKTLEVSGNMNAKEYVHLRFAAGGKITQIGAKEGDYVQKGKMIATIDQRSLQKNLQKSLTTYSKERLDWDQTLDDTEDRWLPQQEDRTKQKEQLDLNTTVLDVELNSIAITNTVLTAPFDGILVSQPVTVPGVIVLATDTFDLVNPNTLYFQAEVDELDIGQIQPGQQAKISFDAYPDETFDSIVQFISFQSKQTSTSTVFLVDLPIKQADLHKFRLGLNGDAVVTLQTKENVLHIPIDSLIEKDDKSFVLVKTGENETTEKEITTGMETDEDIEILSGLTEQDEIVLPN